MVLTKFVDVDNGGDDIAVGQTVNIKQVFSWAIVTDLSVTYNFNKKMSATFAVNNLFNILPSWTLEAQTNAGRDLLKDQARTATLKNNLTFDQRYAILGYNGAQFLNWGHNFS